jgi:hypothetical protein
MIDVIGYSLAIIIFLFLGFSNMRLRIKNLELIEKNLQAHIDKAVVFDKLKTEMQKPGLQNDDFLSFVSKSRDMAFEYIESVQAGIDKFITDVEPEVMYFDTYGDLMSAEPNYNSMKKISGAYKELKQLLPEDYDKIE